MEDGTRMWGRPRWMCAVALFALGGIGAWRVAGGAEAKPPEPELGANASLHGKGVFPADDPWNQDVSAAAVDPNSDKIIASIGEGKSLHPDWASGENSGIPYVVVDGRRQAALRTSARRGGAAHTTLRACATASPRGSPFRSTWYAA